MCVHDLNVMSCVCVDDLYVCVSMICVRARRRRLSSSVPHASMVCLTVCLMCVHLQGRFTSMRIFLC